MNGQSVQLASADSRRTRLRAQPPQRRFTLHRRASGVLMHLTSLPGGYGCGDLGPDALEFAQFLQAAGQRWWQMLPIGPAGMIGHSPYSAYSAFAGNPLLVSLDRLVRDGLLKRDALKHPANLNGANVRYGHVIRFHENRLRRAFDAFRRARGWEDELHEFRHRTEPWLDDYTTFSALKRAFQHQSWILWPKPLRRHLPRAVAEARRELADEIAYHEFVQFQFDRQWQAFKQFCNERDIGLIGDIPIFVDYDSCDVWSHRHLFQLDAAGHPLIVTGCPPDDFNRNGQFWRHPHYDWQVHRASAFAWWVSRFTATMRLFDALRIDHFLGMHRLWAIPPKHKTARRGHWIAGPGAPLFETLRRELGELPIIAEDLGAVTPEALALRDQFGFPGMHVLQFGFGSDVSHLPHRYQRRCVAYTGTHDNDTVVGWFRNASLAERRKALVYLDSTPRQIARKMVHGISTSVADIAVFPMQDLLGLGSDARMNIPGTTYGNWRWRVKPGALTPGLAKNLRALSEATGRLD